MKRNVYKDTMHELVKPILTDTPTDKVLRRKKATQLKKSARQERAWAETAFTEDARNVHGHSNFHVEIRCVRVA